ncbi:hypothetical protein [Halosimplex salinum]|uniref:hypothetical protein n=1 Tax=Halosimplex salinum TaxID=1710538 RepID=UPI000F4AD00A|nr:hypothetical protein [Halosimplex salinum]
MSSARGDYPVAEMEVTGEVVGAVAAGVETFSTESRAAARAILDERGISTAEPGEWYPLSAFVAAIDALHDLVGDHAVHALGQRIARAVSFPTEPGDVPEALTALDEVCRDQHRGGDVGGYSFRQIGDADGRIECHTPYACAFDRGVVEGTAVAHADGFVCVCEVGACRSEGADRCTYEVSW